MLTESTGIQPPNTAQGFEDFCHNVYGTIFNDPTATKNGRSGQKQYGVDVFVRDGERLFGIQCKQKSFAKLTQAIIDEEVAAADKGLVEKRLPAINELIIATTAANDAKLIAYAARLTDERKQTGKFAVNLAFWDTLQVLVKSNPSLQWQYAPHMAGGAIFEFSRKQDEISRKLDDHREVLQVVAAATTTAASNGRVSTNSIPDARLDSLDKLVDSQLDGVKKMLMEGRFAAALESLTSLGQNLGAFDIYQRSRWFSQRAHCYWQQESLEFAAKDFDSAYGLTPADDKTASNHIRGALLRQQYDRALELASEARLAFPASANVFSVWAEAAERCGKRPVWEHDVPPEFRDDADVLHVFGWQALLAGELSAAAEFSKKVADKGTPTFEQASLRLLALVNMATANGVFAGAGIVSEQMLHELAETLQFFEPVDKHIWSRQGGLSTAMTIACVGYAYLMTGKPEEAKKFLLKGVQCFPAEGQLARICLEAIVKADGNITAGYKFGSQHVEVLDEQGQMMVAEMAAETGDIATLERISTILRERNPNDVECDEELRAFEWLALVASGSDEQLDAVLTFDAFRSMTSKVAKVIVANIAFRRKATWAVDAVQSLEKALHDESPTREVIMVSRACIAVGLYSEAAKRLGKILPRGIVSEPHKLLFEALVKGGSRRKALRMLEEFPPTAIDDADIRALALELAEGANDWTELSRLSDLQLKANPGRAEAWTFRAAVLLRQRQPQAVQRLIREQIPLDLQGSTKSRAQLARFEIEFGNPERGFKRLYQVFRRSLADVDVASIYLGNVLTMQPERRPSKPLGVGPATAVTLSVGNTTRQLIIDPADLTDLPKAAHFISVSDPTYAALEGKMLGDAIQLVDGLGIAHDYTVVDINSGYMALAAQAEKLVRESVVPGGPITSIEMQTRDDGQLDLSLMQSMLRARTERIKLALDGYAQGQATIGVVAKLLGVSPLVMSADWPAEPGPKLYACSGAFEEQAASEGLLKSWEGPLVVDLTAINELVVNGMESALSLVKPVYISTSSVEVLDRLIEVAATDRAVGHMSETNGQITMVHYGEGYHEGRRAYLEKLRKCVDEHCEIAPSWGAEELPEDLPRFAEVLDSESYDTLLLCLEKHALLLTLDGRLRELGKVVANIRGVWPQLFCSVATQRGHCTRESYHRFVMSGIARRRTHTAITAGDVVWTAHDPFGPTNGTFGMLLRYISERSVEALSTARVIADAAIYILTHGATAQAVFQFIETAFAPLFTRDDVDADSLERLLAIRLVEAIQTLFNSNTPNIYLQSVLDSQSERWQGFIEETVRKARMLATETPIDALCDKSVPVMAMYVTRYPCYIATQSAQDLMT
ncbi:tetratricopeptide repeat protein [Burkholderia ubonensis]|uniref:PIN domain-containing protein n=1 Tax=Burkholderia ubonensis TaxID=101571 RepID=A0A107ESR4_9BURK|nr:hypothetical protein [Burkholderia ubonensis]AOK61073.1 hypothetical protein WM29_17750 [Burkholderia ubonensis]KWD80608.1 hypothetical protein WL71_20420 [Burkholderia ubonensis]KWD86528.1 hypothetical protein WL70_10790 [Burkholderia ubonensis]KWE03606.1 hypothetical protein WL72_04375 [Burkholderia ubonensis]KWE12747.1 hypothetical protein WL73_31645 [Burkholderia ubonensis]